MSLTPKTVPTGAIRYNTDSNKMECFNGTKWMQVAVSSPDLNGGARGVTTGGYTGPGSTGNAAMDYFNIESTGNVADFGDITDGRWAITAGSSNTRGIWAGGDSPGDVNIIDYITISSTGDAQDFGDIGTGGHRYGGGLANQTRMLICGGDLDPHPNQMNTIYYITIATLGNAIDSGGDLTNEAQSFTSSCCNPTRGLICGGFTPSDVTTIDLVSIPSMGNAQDFGNLTATGNTEDGIISSSTRGLIKISKDGTNKSQVDAIQMATLGNSYTFGDLSTTRTAGSGCSSKIRGIFAGGRVTPAEGQTDIDYMTIATEGAGVDFGDLNYSSRAGSGLSNAHGGL